MNVFFLAFERQVLGTIDDLSVMMCRLEVSMNQLHVKFSASRGESLPDMPTTIPVKNVDDLAALDNFLNDVAKRKSLVGVLI